jgi:protein-tyrosine-phosphatase
MAPSPTAPPLAVLFACTRNVVRSPIAAALMRHYFGKRVYVASAGLSHGEADGFAIAVMAEIGIEIGSHRSRTFEELGDVSFDLIVSLSPEAQHHAARLTERLSLDIEYWPTLDPSIFEGSREQRLAAYRAIRDALDSRIRARFALGPDTPVLPRPA